MGTEQEQLVKAEELLQVLMNASEKAANIARACRGESTLFSLLVEEKKDSEKNKRFFQDFKTLADVLVQECVSHDVSKRFPGIEESIQGEESNQFTNTLGESICVKVMATEAETENLLAKVLDGNKNAAVLLANLVHKDIKNSVVEPRLDSSIQLPLNDIGIWIDPIGKLSQIDSTSEYVNGQWEKPGVFGIASSGLQSVCVLIGVYSLLSGAPVLGVVNQPFYAWNYSLNRWTGRSIWGFCHQKTTFNVEKLLHNVSSELAANTPLDKSVMTISSSEASPLVSALKDKYEVVFAAGAGYKVLSVASGLANLYLLTKGSTFRWDTCAPHAILRSLGGGVINLKQALSLPLDSLLDNEENLQLIYNCPEEGVRGIDRWCNVDGFIAYRDTASLLELVQFLKEVNLKP